ncbi:MAG TPA: aspartate aminotransferase family protein [Candidatus Baltobacteraceae bacterium]
MNDDFERLRGPVPGPRTAALLARLRSSESHNVTFLSDEFPVFWESASGATVTDVDGNRYIDLTAAFGVANVGHANPRVVAAIAEQAALMTHGMGDVHPTAVKAQLLERLPQILPAGLTKTFLATTGSEAVEAAFKTAMLATGKPAFASYRNSYHGLSLGALSVIGIEKFRAPFRGAVVETGLLLEYPRAERDDPAAALAAARAALSARNDIAAIVIEPMQGRAGEVVPPYGYLSGLRALCDELGIVLIFDEIFTGFGRTGAWFCANHENVSPDIICIGKAMGGGFPISAAVARAEIMDAWPVSAGEALHTSTYLGNPMGCAAALATIDELARFALPERAAALGVELGARLETLRRRGSVLDVRGRGLMWGIELTDARVAARVVTQALARGVIVLQAGPEGNALSITPPLVIAPSQLHRALDIVEELL